MFLRRIYYDITSGTILNSFMMQGDIEHYPQSKDFEIQPALQGRNLDDTACMEWLEPDTAIEDNFSRATSYSIVAGQLAFDFTPLPEPEPAPDTAEMTEALEILGVTV
jgi:hypothetical protein